jgi:hypothetical protein
MNVGMKWQTAKFEPLVDGVHCNITIKREVEVERDGGVDPGGSRFRV